ncbi:MAG: hypothetical protein CSA76_01020 [Spirochaetales bacterium]|nr:MAG: hypothetical protein CSA76_01020 [Spirochaetales bacterium]
MDLLAVGSYTHHSSLDARGSGVSIVERDGNSGNLRVVDSYGDLRNPTYLAWLPEKRILYAVSEFPGKNTGVAAFGVDVHGRLDFLGEAGGKNASSCHLTVVPEACRIYTASYGDGSLNVFGTSGGIPDRLIGAVRYTGSGADTVRQESSHAHQAVMGPGGFLYVCDLGSDCVWLHKPEDLENSGGRAGAGRGRSLTVPAGFGPRHLLFDPVLPAAYVLCELVPKILVARVDSASGKMEIIQEEDTVEASGFDIAAPAALKMHPSGRTLAVSNRFDDTVAVFDVRRPAGSGDAGPRLELSGRFPCGGKAPRDIEFDSSGSTLFIANQDSHNVSCRSFNAQSGKDAGSWESGLQTGTPVCVLMLDSSNK